MSTRRLLASLAGSVALVLVLAVLLWSRHARPSPPSVPTETESIPSASQAPPEAPVEDRTPEIHGRILDADGNAVTGAAVRLVSTSSPYTVARETKSVGGGAFSFARVPPGDARVEADHDADGVVTSAVVRAEAGQSVEVILVLSAARQVRGTVVDAQEHPVEAALVSADGIGWTVSATSDKAGAFTLPAAPDEATAVVAVARGFRSGRATLPAQGERTVRIVLTAANPIDGEVHDADGNAVSADVVACEGQPAETRAQSGADGKFQLAPSAIGCEAVAEQGEFAPSDPAPVVEGEPLSLQLKAGGTIEGVVVDERGAGLTPVTVGIESFVPGRGKARPGGAPRTSDDLRGGFRWEKLAPGSYILTASTPGRPAARSEPIDVRGGAVSRVTIVVPQGGILVGHVYGPGGVVAGARLHFDAVSSVLESKASAVSDDTGEYRLEEAPAGPFTLRVEKEGMRTRLVSGLYVAAGTTARQDVTLSAVDGGGGLELGGIGAGLRQSPAGFVVQKAFPGDPAAVAGLKDGDILLRIDGDSVDGMSMADVLTRIRGEPGTTVGVSVQRPGTGQVVDAVIVRAQVVH